MKVGIYARVSKDEKQTDNRYQDPENQLSVLREYCKRMDWEVHKEYVDFWSGADPNRPKFKEMLQDAYMRWFDVILVWKLDRFSREPMFVQMGYINHLKEKGIGVVSLTESWLDTRKENPTSELLIAIMTWVAGEERRKISERTKLGIARRKQIGQYKGGRPIGWRKNKGGSVLDRGDKPI
jgi:site-specific DNA recombinase